MKDALSTCGKNLNTKIDVWVIDLNQPLDSQVNPDDFLSSEEREHASRYKFAVDSFRFSVCRAMLRLGLAKLIDTDPRKIELITNNYGKPSLAKPASLHFNVSHSAGIGLIAFTTVGEVGIDVEASQSRIDAVEIASDNFTRNEAKMVATAATPEQRLDIFLRLWTRKEALFKAVGSGIGEGLDTVDVSEEAVNRVRVIKGGFPETCWKVMDLTLVSGYWGAIAAPAGDWSITQREIRYEDAISGRCDGIG